MRRQLSVLMVAVAGLVLAGCGDDDDGGDSAAADTGAGSDAGSGDDGEAGEDDKGEHASEVTGGDLEKFCKLGAKLEDAIPTEADAETPEEIGKVFQQFLKDNKGDIDDFIDAAPDEVKPATEALKGAFEKVAAGDLSALQDPELEKQGDALEQFQSEHCDS